MLETARRGINCMLEIVICDDEKALRHDLRKILSQELDLYGEDYLIKEFDCGENLLKSLDANGFDILFLDIEMKELDGVATATELRKQNVTAEIIFVTSHPDFVFQGYEVQALHYILKPYQKEKILSVLHTALARLGKEKEKYYLIEQRGGSIRLPLSTVKYFCSDKRFVTAVTTNQKHAFYGQLSELEYELPEYFIRIHNRYLVNLNYIQSIQGNLAICGSDELPVSRASKQTLAIAFAKYMLE